MFVELWSLPEGRTRADLVGVFNQRLRGGQS